MPHGEANPCEHTDAGEMSLGLKHSCDFETTYASVWLHPQSSVEPTLSALGYHPPVHEVTYNIQNYMKIISNFVNTLLIQTARHQCRGCNISFTCFLGCIKKHLIQLKHFIVLMFHLQTSGRRSYMIPFVA